MPVSIKEVQRGNSSSAYMAAKSIIEFKDSVDELIKAIEIHIKGIRETSRMSPALAKDLNTILTYLRLFENIETDDAVNRLGMTMDKDHLEKLNE